MSLSRRDGSAAIWFMLGRSQVFLTSYIGTDSSRGVISGIILIPSADGS